MVVDVDELTPRQRDRFTRVLSAAIDLASEGGYEAVHMRAVSARSSVALGTIYRYFSCKDELLIHAMADWTGRLRERVEQRPPRGSSPSEQVTEVLRRACRSLERQPQLAAALVRALSSPDVGVSRSNRAVGNHIRAMLTPSLQHLPADMADDVIVVLNHVWISALIQWTNGRIPLSEVAEQLAKTSRLLLDNAASVPVAS